jgi:3-oxoacyl-(acyl-carrier-protein) synthase
MVRTVDNTLRSARVSNIEVDSVNASANACPRDDECERVALEQVFGASSRSPHVTSGHGATGHTLGASGAFSLALTALSVAGGAVPPIAHLNRQVQGDLDYVRVGRKTNGRIAHAARSHRVQLGELGTDGACKHRVHRRLDKKKKQDRIGLARANDCRL